MDGITPRTQSVNEFDVGDSGERRLKTKIVSAFREPLDLFQHQPTSGKCCGLGRKWRQALGDEIRVDEVFAVGVMRKKFARESRLARAVRSGNNVNGWTRQGTSLSSLQSNEQRLPAGQV